MGKRLTIKAFQNALKGTGGIYTAIAKKAGCDRQTVAKLVKRSVKAQELLEQERAGVCDMAEGSLFKNIREGDAWAVKYFLSTKGRSRGYVERREVEHSGSVSWEDFARVYEEVMRERKET